MSGDIEISQQHNEDRLAGTLLNLQRGGLPPRMRVYANPRAGGIGVAPSAVLLAEFVFRSPAGTIVDGKLVLDLPPMATLLASGDARWARFFTGEGNASMDVPVSYPDGTGAVRFEEINGLVAGNRLRLVLAEIR